jgi:hypothetical protein
LSNASADSGKTEEALKALKDAVATNLVTDKPVNGDKSKDQQSKSGYNEYAKSMVSGAVKKLSYLSKSNMPSIPKLGGWYARKKSPDPAQQV